MKSLLVVIAVVTGLPIGSAAAEGDPAPTYRREAQLQKYKGCHWTDEMGKYVYECIKKNDGFGTHWCYDETLETYCPAQLEAAQSKLDDLRSLGVRLAIDDFGTGHSNLALLRKLSADFVKIDRSLIDGLGTIPGDTQLVRMILSLTEELGFAPVAEGVSTEVQLAELVRLRCRLAQGHLFAEPLTLVDALDYVSQASDQTVGVD